MGLGPQALQEIARVNHPIRSPSAFRSFLFAQIERERGKERERDCSLAGYGSRDLPAVRIPFYFAFTPSLLLALTFFFRPFAILVCFLFSRLSFFFLFELLVSFVSSLSLPSCLLSLFRLLLESFFYFAQFFFTSKHFVLFFLLSLIFPNIGSRYRTISLYIYGGHGESKMFANFSGNVTPRFVRGES